MLKGLLFTLSLAVGGLGYLVHTQQPLQSAPSLGATTLQVIQGGTGSTTLSGILLGNGTSLVRTLSIGSGLTFSGTSLSLNTSGTWSGLAGTATALAANGTNCTAGNYPLGVDASGNSENCTTAASVNAFEIATTSDIAISQLTYVTKTSGKTTVGSVATGTVSSSGGITTTAGRSAVGGALSIACDVASGSIPGCLAAADWTTFNGKVSTTRALTVAGTAQQITSSAGSQDLSADRTWTLSLPNYVNFPSSYSAALGSTTNATSTNFTATTLASTTALRVSNVPNALLLTASGGLAGAYGGASACAASNFVTTISSVGATTCGTATISGVSLGGTLASHSTNSSLSGTSYNGSATVSDWGINLGNSNSWTVLQNFTLASTTQLSALDRIYVGRTATTTIRGDGVASIIPYASTTAITVSGTASSTSLIVSGLNAASCDVKADTNGVFSCGTDATGAGASFPFTPTTNYGALTNATGTPMWLQAGLQASTTNNYFAGLTVDSGAAADAILLQGKSAFEWASGYNNTNNNYVIASSTDLTSNVGLSIDKNLKTTLGGALTVTGQTTLATSLTGLALTTSGVVSAYGGASCTNQFPRSQSASGAWTCATVGAADVSLANLTATDSTLTFSGTYNGSTARTIGINLANLNSWTGQQTFTNASSTNFSALTRLWIPNAADPTITLTGDLGINTTAASTSLRFYDGTAERVLNNIKTKSFIVASSTLAYIGAYGAAGTTTLLLWNPERPITLVNATCRTDVGTGKVNFNDGTNLSTMLSCSTTGARTTLSTNNTWVMSEDFKVSIGTIATAPNVFTITLNYREDAD